MCMYVCYTFLEALRKTAGHKSMKFQGTSEREDLKNDFFPRIKVRFTIDGKQKVLRN